MKVSFALWDLKCVFGLWNEIWKRPGCFALCNLGAGERKKRKTNQASYCLWKTTNLRILFRSSQMKTSIFSPRESQSTQTSQQQEQSSTTPQDREELATLPHSAKRLFKSCTNANPSQPSTAALSPQLCLPEIVTSRWSAHVMKQGGHWRKNVPKGRRCTCIWGQRGQWWRAQ